MIIIYTMAFNAEKTILRAIKSVQNQTEQNWRWYLLDNGSCDGTGALIQRCAEADSRIIPLANQDNCVFHGTHFLDIMYHCEKRDWFCLLDADDEYKPNFLADMLTFAERERLDVAACGSDFIDEATGNIFGQRILPDDLIISGKEDFDRFLPLYHQFMRSNWGKLYSGQIIPRFNMEHMAGASIYGGDTLYSQEMLWESERFGIRAGTLHRYYTGPKSISTQWNPLRSEADRILYRSACSFLIDKCGSVSPRNRDFLQCVYSNAVADTVNVIQNSGLSPAEKLREYHAIAAHPITLAAYRECGGKEAERSRARLLMGALRAGAALSGREDADLRAAAQTLLPRCGPAVTAASAGMFLKDRTLSQALLRDDAGALLEKLLERMEKNRDVKQYPIPETIRALAADDPTLCQIDDPAFLRAYGSVYRKVWQGRRLDALDEMAGLLMEDRGGGGRETLLTLFVSLAALENQVPAFLFGKIQLAELYLRQGRREECRAILSDLAEMGVEGEELDALRRELDQ